MKKKQNEDLKKTTWRFKNNGKIQIKVLQWIKFCFEMNVFLVNHEFTNSSRLFKTFKWTLNASSATLFFIISTRKAQIRFYKPYNKSAWLAKLKQRSIKRDIPAKRVPVTGQQNISDASHSGSFEKSWFIKMYNSHPHLMPKHAARMKGENLAPTEKLSRPV